MHPVARAVSAVALTAVALMTALLALATPASAAKGAEQYIGRNIVWTPSCQLYRTADCAPVSSFTVTVVAPKCLKHQDVSYEIRSVGNTASVFIAGDPSARCANRTRTAMQIQVDVPDVLLSLGYNWKW